MTKADMIETVVNDAIKRDKRLDQMVALYGEDSQQAGEARREWHQSFSMVNELGLFRVYMNKSSEQFNEWFNA